MRSTGGAADFGVVIPAKEEHLHWVRGTCASVRYFMGDVPICVILDGRRFPDELRRTYGASVTRSCDVEPRELRAGFGSLKAKDVALWASPFETFLLFVRGRTPDRVVSVVRGRLVSEDGPHGGES